MITIFIKYEAMDQNSYRFDQIIDPFSLIKRRHNDEKSCKND